MRKLLDMPRRAAINRERIDRIRDALLALPPVDHVSKADAIRLLAPAIRELRKKGYTMAEITAHVVEQGLEVTVESLQSYLRRAGDRPERRRRPTRPGPNPRTSDALEQNTTPAVLGHITVVAGRSDGEGEAAAGQDPGGGEATPESRADDFAPSGDGRWAGGETRPAAEQASLGIAPPVSAVRADAGAATTAERPPAPAEAHDPEQPHDASEDSGPWKPSPGSHDTGRPETPEDARDGHARTRNDDSQVERGRTAQQQALRHGGPSEPASGARSSVFKAGLDRLPSTTEADTGGPPGCMGDERRPTKGTFVPRPDSEQI